MQKFCNIRVHQRRSPLPSTRPMPPGTALRILSLVGCIVLLSGCFGQTADTSGDHDYPPAGDGLRGDAEANSYYQGQDPAPTNVTVGSIPTFEIATWNIYNFPRSGTTEEKVYQLIRDMRIDLLAVQEIADQDAFDNLLARLPDYDGLLTTHTYSDGTYQKTGFIYRSAILSVESIQSLMLSEWYAFPRPPLQVTFTLQQVDGSDITFIAIDIHLKAYTSAEDLDRRRQAIQKLKAHTDEILNQGDIQSVFIIGDFNDEPDDPSGENVFTPFLDDNFYDILTMPEVNSGDHSFIPYHTFIDHIILAGSMLPAYSGEDTIVHHVDDVLSYDYESSVSDHLPVVAVFEQ